MVKAVTCSFVIRFTPSLTRPIDPCPIVFPNCQLPKVLRGWDFALSNSALCCLGDENDLSVSAPKERGGVTIEGPTACDVGGSSADNAFPPIAEPSITANV